MLLAEDNPVNQEVARCMVESFGCRVDVTSNGQEALDALSKTPYDLVFMDCQMPELDGYAATRIFREKEAQKTPGRAQADRRTPIIAMTGLAMQGDREQCLAIGMDDYLNKPFNLNGLLTMLKRWLPPKLTTSLSVTDVVDCPAEAENLAPAPTCPSNYGTVAGPNALDAGFLDRLSLMEFVDRKAFENLRPIARRPAGAPKTIRIYMESSSKLVDTLRQSITFGDAEAVQGAAHSLRSASEPSVP